MLPSRDDAWPIAHATTRPGDDASGRKARPDVPLADRPGDQHARAHRHDPGTNRRIAGRVIGEVVLDGGETVERELRIHVDPEAGDASGGSIYLDFQAASGLQTELHPRCNAQLRRLRPMPGVHSRRARRSPSIVASVGLRPRVSHPDRDSAATCCPDPSSAMRSTSSSGTAATGRATRRSCASTSRERHRGPSRRYGPCWRACLPSWAGSQPDRWSIGASSQRRRRAPERRAPGARGRPDRMALRRCRSRHGRVRGR